jgi:hypothetical protein
MRTNRFTPPGSARALSFLFVLMTSLFLVSCSKDQILQELDKLVGGGQTDREIPSTINFTRPGLYPEGVAHDDLYNRFLVTSLRTGTIGSVSYDGTYSPFIQDEKLISTIGLEVDEARRRVLVAVSDPGAGEKTSPTTAGKLAALGIYDQVTGSQIRFVNLGELRPDGRHFANDITIDANGTAYVTDSFSPIIYKVDRAGKASVFFENAAFATDPGQFGFNGIAYHPDGFLLVAFSRDNKIIRIPVNNPSAYEEVQLNMALMGPDGLLLSKDGKQLIVVNNAGGQAPGKVLSFESNDNWKTGMVEESFETGAVFPTTATAANQDIFVLYAYLNKIFGGADSPQSVFTIKKVPFSDNRDF